MSHPPVGLAGGLGGRGVPLPQPVPLSSLGGQHCGRHRRRSGRGGRNPHTAPVHRQVPPLGLVRASLLCAGVGSPACRDPRGSRRRGVWRRVACGSSCALPPQASRSLLGEGGHPLCLGGGMEGRRPRSPQAGGGSGGGGGGDVCGRSLPPCSGSVVHGGRPCLLGHPLRVYTFSRGCRAAVGAGCSLSAAGGSVWRGGGGGGLFAEVCPLPPSPGGHGGGPLRLLTPGCRRSAAARGVGAELLVGSG